MMNLLQANGMKEKKRSRYFNEANKVNKKDQINERTI